MILVTVFLRILLVGKVLGQNTSTEETTLILDIEQTETTTVIVDTKKPETTVTVATDQEETTTVTVEVEDPRETCRYKQKRPGFACDSGQCVDRGGVCDQRKDCSDESDETISCCSSTCITPTRVSVCIPSDGYNYTNVECRWCTKSGYPGYRCDDGACIYRRKVCDGRSQCKDNSDEKYCAAHLCQTDLGAFVNVPRDMVDKTGDCRKCDYNKEGDGFRCDNAKCILAAWKCDGTEDCSDGSDETDQLCNPEVVQDVARQPKLGPTASPSKAVAGGTSEHPSGSTVSGSRVPGPCPSGWKCVKYSHCSQFDRFVVRGGLFADLRCSSDNLSWVCCDPEGKFAGFGPEITDYDYEK